MALFGFGKTIDLANRPKPYGGQVFKTYAQWENYVNTTLFPGGVYDPTVFTGVQPFPGTVVSREDYLRGYYQDIEGPAVDIFTKQTHPFARFQSFGDVIKDVGLTTAFLAAPLAIEAAFGAVTPEAGAAIAPVSSAPAVSGGASLAGSTALLEGPTSFAGVATELSAGGGIAVGSGAIAETGTLSGGLIALGAAAGSAAKGIFSGVTEAAVQKTQGEIGETIGDWVDGLFNGNNAPSAPGAESSGGTGIGSLLSSPIFPIVLIVLTVLGALAMTSRKRRS